MDSITPDWEIYEKTLEGYWGYKDINPNPFKIGMYIYLQVSKEAHKEQCLLRNQHNTLLKQHLVTDATISLGD